MIIDEFMKEFFKEQLEVARSLDIEKARAYAKKYHIFLPDNEISIIAGLHKARLYINGITAEEKEISRKWLKENGFSEKI